MTSEASGLSQLGHSTSYRYDHPDASMLDAFPNPSDRAWVVALDCPEFTSLCPVTGQPDFGRVQIHYVAGPSCVESKSLKLYLGAFRNHGAFHEDCINRIADDLDAVLAPRYLRVYGDFRPRGGIAIRPLALRQAPDLGPDEHARCVELLAQLDAVSRGPHQ